MYMKLELRACCREFFDHEILMDEHIGGSVVNVSIAHHQ